MSTHQKSNLAQELGVKLVPHLSKYLGVNFKLRGNRIADFQDLINKISSKLQGWKAKLLSQTGRLTLINSVLTSIPIYTFSMFKIPETVCKRLDSLINAFWWGHDPGRKKLHMTNWDTITKTKTQGGLGIKKFGPMNKALITKQYWCIKNNPNLLFSKTLKAKYCPNEDLHSHKPNQKASWIWRNIMGQNNPNLCQAAWRVGRGYNIPISHPDWFKIKPNAPQSLQNQLTTVADLIDHRTASWKTHLIYQLYEKQDVDQILSITLPVVENNAAPDKLIWPHSLNGEYQVRKAYEILTQQDTTSRLHPSSNNQTTIWKLLWKTKLPHKILTFTWKLLHHAFPTKAELNSRGVHCAMNCIMCNTAIETQGHLFLHCDLSRAVWFGDNIPILHLTQVAVTVDSWVKDLLKQSNTLDNTNPILQKTLTLLWCIWFHRNQILFAWKQPNPMEIILTFNSLLNRFLQNFANNAGTNAEVRNIARAPTWIPDPSWQAIILTTGGKTHHCTRLGLAYMGKFRDGQVMFVGCKTINVQDINMARLLAIREAIIKATELVLQSLIILTEGKDIGQMWANNHISRWKLTTILQDIKNI